MNETAKSLLKKIQDHGAKVGIIGLGYVGLPLALCFTEKNFKVLGFDVDPEKVEKLNRGECYIKHLDQNRINKSVNNGLFDATDEFDRLSECDAILICVPTPLGKHKEPDLSYVENSTKQIRKTLRKGQLIILESTTYPGTTDELLKDILELRKSKQPVQNVESKSAMECDDNSSLITHNSSLTCGLDFFLAFSPEREDPGNPNFGTQNTPKVVGGVDEISGDLAEALYAEVLDSTVRVKNARTAEASKLVENIFRGVNIALVNELKMIFEKMDIDIWDVLDAAETKPFGFMRFNPGPGLGGHCVRGDQQIRVRGLGLEGLYLADDLYRRLRGECDTAITRGGMFLQTPGLEALALNRPMGEVRWFPVNCLYRGRFQGEGIAIQATEGRSLVVTSEHPMLVQQEGSFEVAPAKEVRPGAELPVIPEKAVPDCEPRYGLCSTFVTAVSPIALSGFVYSLEVGEAETFASNSGIVVHNCIPLDPFYLAWKARESGQPTRFIELAGEINTQMPAYVIEKLTQALNEQGKSVKGSKVLVLGLAYKPNIDDPRESPSFEIIELLLELGADVRYHDPHIPVAPKMRSWPELPPMQSIPLNEETLRGLEAAIVITNHNDVDYGLILANTPLVIDTRGTYREPHAKVIKA